MTDQQPILKLDQVDTFYGPIQALRSIDIEIYPGQMICLLDLKLVILAGYMLLISH